MKHVIITGGAGFIGSHLCQLFLDRGYAVTALDNFVTGQRSNLDELKGYENFSFIEKDVCDLEESDVAHQISQYGLHGVLHFACPASPVDFDRIPFEILKVDSIGTMKTTDIALQHGCRFLVASTSEVYGDPLVHPQKESYWGNVNSIGPRACYDETKRFAEAYVSAMSRGDGSYRGESYKPLNGGIVRIFNTYGPRMRGDDGRVVPEFCLQALEGRDITLHGDGRQTRSFCYVSDLVRGIFLLFESDEKNPVNIGNPTERTVRDFAENVITITGSKSQMIETDPRPDDPKQRCPDITRAKEILGWNPEVDLKEGLQKTVEYFRTLQNSN